MLLKKYSWLEWAWVASHLWHIVRLSKQVVVPKPLASSTGRTNTYILLDNTYCWQSLDQKSMQLISTAVMCTAFWVLSKRSGMTGWTGKPATEVRNRHVFHTNPVSGFRRMPPCTVNTVHSHRPAQPHCEYQQTSGLRCLDDRLQGAVSLTKQPICNEEPLLYTADSAFSS